MTHPCYCRWANFCGCRAPQQQQKQASPQQPLCPHANSASFLLLNTRRTYVCVYRVLCSFPPSGKKQPCSETPHRRSSAPCSLYAAGIPNPALRKPCSGESGAERANGCQYRRQRGCLLQIQDAQASRQGTCMKKCSRQGSLLGGRYHQWCDDTVGVRVVHGIVW